jgi:hypothetical protein
MSESIVVLVPLNEVYQCHKIPVPEGSHSLTMQFRGSPQTPPSIHIILPRKKVKKWYIEITTLGGPVINTKESYTEKEIRKIMDVFPYAKVRRVTEIEVEAD